VSYDRERFDITDEAAWLAARAVDLTSTEVATLYGLNPYSTLFETWHRKKAGEAVQRTDTDRMKWGRRLEAVVALGVAEDLGWKAEPRKIYQRIPGAASRRVVRLPSPARTGWLGWPHGGQERRSQGL
jgi:predicted phage-related endonuclease